jgi:hypothetical protein
MKRSAYVVCSDISEEYVSSIFRAEEACYLLHVGFLLDLFFDSGDVGDMFLRNVG